MEITKVEEMGYEVTVASTDEIDAISSAKAIEMATTRIEWLTGSAAVFKGFHRIRDNKIVVRLEVN